MKQLLVEWKKARRRKIWLVVLSSVVLIALWVIWGYHPSAEQRAMGYHALFYQLPLLNTIVQPIVMAVLASRIWDTEHKGDLYKLLYTLQNRTALWNAKTSYGLFCALTSVCLQAVFVLFFGRLYQITQPLDYGTVFWMTLCLFAVHSMLFLIQQIVTVQCENQVAALALGLVGSFFGLFSAFFPESFQFAVPWAYYALLSTVGMNWEEDTRLITYYVLPPRVWLLVFVLGICVVLYAIGRFILKRKEV